jgi:hypothetical protein
MKKEISKIQADRKVKLDPKGKGGKRVNKEERKARKKAIRFETNALNSVRGKFFIRELKDYRKQIRKNGIRR